MLMGKDDGLKLQPFGDTTFRIKHFKATAKYTM
jgi:hypothetical protein